MIRKKSDLLENDLGQVTFMFDPTKEPHPTILFSISTGGGQCILHNVCKSGNIEKDVASFIHKLLNIRNALITINSTMIHNVSKCDYIRISKSGEKSSAAMVYNVDYTEEELVLMFTDCKQVCRVVFRGRLFTGDKKNEFLHNLYTFINECIEELSNV